MKAEEFLKEKYKKGGCYPWSQFDYSEMVANMEEFAQQQLKNCNLQSVNARTFEIGEKVQWRGMELIVVEIGVNELLIATDTNPDVENYNDWWVGVEYVR